MCEISKRVCADLCNVLVEKKHCILKESLFTALSKQWKPANTHTHTSLEVKIQPNDHLFPSLFDVVDQRLLRNQVQYDGL